MLAIYDSTGKIITAETKQTDITGALNSMEVTAPDNKVLDHMDISQVPNAPVFKDIPKTDFQTLEEKVSNGLALLGMKDYEHDGKIKDLYYQVSQINAFLKQNFNMKGSEN